MSTPLVDHSLPFSTAFISHAGEDKLLALRLVEKMESIGCKCWCSSSRSIAIGQKWDREIMQGLRKSEVLILLLTTASNESEHVEREVKLAFGMNKPVLPIRMGKLETSDALAYWLANQQLVDITPDDEGLDLALHALSGVSHQQHQKSAPTRLKTQWKWRVALLLALVVGLILAYTSNVNWNENFGTLTDGSTAAEHPVSFLALDGSPLQGKIIPSSRAVDKVYQAADGSLQSIQNGVLTEIKIRNTLAKWPHRVGYKFSFPGQLTPLDSADRPSPKVAVDPTAVRDVLTTAGPPVILGDSGECFLFEFLEGERVHAVLGEPDSSFVCTPGIYVGFGGSIPPGPLPVELSIYDMTSGEVVKTEAKGKLHRFEAPLLGSARFTIHVPDVAGWDMGGKPKKVQLLNAADPKVGFDEMTIQATTSTVYPTVGKDGTRSNALQFSYKFKALGSDVSGPLRVCFYPLQVRIGNHNQASSTLTEMRITPEWALARPPVLLPQGSFFEFTTYTLNASQVLLQQAPPIHWIAPIPMGPTGSIPLGEQWIGIRVVGNSELLYCSKAKLNVSEGWTMPDGDAKIQVLDASGMPIDSNRVSTERFESLDHVHGRQTKRFTNGIRLPLRFINQGKPLLGPITARFYVRSHGGSEVTGMGKLEMEYPMIHSLPSGYTHFWNYPLKSIDNGTPFATGATIVEPEVFIGTGSQSKGTFGVGNHDVGLEITYTDPSQMELVAFRGVLSLAVK